MKHFIKNLGLATLLTGLLVGCGGDSNTASTGGGTAEGTTTGGNSDGQVVIQLFTNQPDRTSGQGLLEQTLIDEFMSLNENIIIEVEALDEEAYKTKFRAYAMDEMPDVVNVWGQPSFISDVIDAGVLEPLDLELFESYGFLSGSLDGFMKNGQLYGAPKTTDVMAFYYHSALFEEYGWEVPNTYEELLALAQDIKGAGLIPLAMDGGDSWPLAIYYTDLIMQLVGSEHNSLIENAIATQDFSDPVFTEAAELLKDAVNSGLFQNGYDTQDYATAMNLFTNGQAAMFYMGSWEAAMAVTETIDQDIRDNILAFTMPSVSGGSGVATDITAWNGNGYSVAAGSKVKEEAIAFVEFMYQADKLSKYSWELGVGMSAQDQSDYMTGTETALQQEFLSMTSEATAISGTPINDLGTANFKSVFENNIQNLCNGAMTTDEFLSVLENACG